MKPHEQQWEARTNYVEFSDAKGRHVGHADVFSDKGEASGQALIAFIAAAPDMARALLDVLRDGRITATNPLYHRINDALRKAGVI